MPASRLRQRISATALIVLGTLAACASSASAGVLVAAAPSCADQALSKPFLPWLDLADYTALPGGDFEAPAVGWSTTGAAAVVKGNSPFQVGGSGDGKSLSLPAGSSATSAPICVGITHPTLRFFAKRTSGGLLSQANLRVDVLYETASGAVQTQAIGYVSSLGSWQPTLPMPIVANLLALLPDEQTPVAFGFTAQNASWSIDDVWVDPYNRR